MNLKGEKHEKCTTCTMSFFIQLMENETTVYIKTLTWWGFFFKCHIKTKTYGEKKNSNPGTHSKKLTISSYFHLDNEEEFSANSRLKKDAGFRI